MRPRLDAQTGLGTESGTPNFSVGDKLWPARWADHALLRNEGARYQSQGRWNLRSEFAFQISSMQHGGSSLAQPPQRRLVERT